MTEDREQNRRGEKRREWRRRAESKTKRGKRDREREKALMVLFPMYGMHVHFLSNV